MTQSVCFVPGISNTGRRQVNENPKNISKEKNTVTLGASEEIESTNKDHFSF